MTRLITIRGVMITPRYCLAVHKVSFHCAPVEKSINFHLSVSHSQLNSHHRIFHHLLKATEQLHYSPRFSPPLRPLPSSRRQFEEKLNFYLNITVLLKKAEEGKRLGTTVLWLLISEDASRNVIIWRGHRESQGGSRSRLNCKLPIAMHGGCWVFLAMTLSMTYACIWPASSLISIISMLRIHYGFCWLRWIAVLWAEPRSFANYHLNINMVEPQKRLVWFGVDDETLAVYSHWRCTLRPSINQYTVTPPQAIH